MKTTFRNYLKEKEESIKPNAHFVENLDKRVLNQIQITKSKMENSNKSKDTAEVKKEKFSFNYWLRYAFTAVCLFMIAFGGVTIYKNSQNGQGIITLAQAKEEIQKQVTALNQRDIIIHTKSTQKMFAYKPQMDPSLKDLMPKEDMLITYEFWDDRNSRRLRSEATYPDGKSTTVHDGDIQWSYMEKVKMLGKEVYKYVPPSSKEDQKPGETIVLLTEFKDILGEKNQTVTEKTKNGVFYTVIEQVIEPNGPEGLIRKIKSRYYFDKVNFHLKYIEDYDLAGGREELVVENEYSVYESLPRTEESMKKLFTFDVKVPNDVEVRTTEILIDINPNIPTAAPTIDPKELDQEKTEAILNKVKTTRILENDFVKFSIPKSWEITEWGCTSKECSHLKIKKNNYSITLTSNPNGTSVGGFGGKYMGICEDHKTYEETAFNDKLVKVDVYADMDNNCFPIKKSGIRWTGGLIKNKGNFKSEPYIALSEKPAIVSITFGYEGEDLPIKDSAELKSMQKEMDEIAKSIEFKKAY